MQVERLLKAIDPGHVEKKQNLSYMAQHQVRAELTRIFGVGNWDSQVEGMELLWETAEEKNGKTMYRACYKARVRLTIRDYWGNYVCSFVEEHVEANSNLPDRGEAHAMAVTSVESYALRRAAIGLGDRLGLGLYDKGSLAPLTRGSLQLMDPEAPLYRAPANPEQGAEKSSSEGLAKMQSAMKVATPDAQ
jgi:recombination DNA repair RAD52 pathway protein